MKKTILMGQRVTGKVDNPKKGISGKSEEMTFGSKSER